MKKLRKFILSISVLLFCVFGAYIILQLKVDPIFSNEVVDSWGYKSTGTNIGQQRSWERERFGNARIRNQSIESVKKMSDLPAPYTFVLTEETYASNESARKRFEELRWIPSGIDTKMEPRLVLRKGCVKDNKVYIISTRVCKFFDEEISFIHKDVLLEIEKK